MSDRLVVGEGVGRYVGMVTEAGEGGILGIKVAGVAGGRLLFVGLATVQVGTDGGGTAMPRPDLHTTQKTTNLQGSTAVGAGELSTERWVRPPIERYASDCI